MGYGTVNAEQYEQLMKPLNSTRVATRQQGGKQISYLESWDVRAHLIRIFGFGNFDLETLSAALLYQRDVEVGSSKSPGWEVAWSVTMQLTVYAVNEEDSKRFAPKEEIARYSETAVGSAVGSVNLGDLHDNAVKQGASDALKRCAINLGTQFGLSLYDNGTRSDVVKGTIVTPGGTSQKATGDDLTAEQRKILLESLGATPALTDHAIASEDPLVDPSDRTDMAGAVPNDVIRTPEDAAKVAADLKGKSA